MSEVLTLHKVLLKYLFSIEYCLTNEGKLLSQIILTLVIKSGIFRKYSFQNTTPFSKIQYSSYEL